MKREESKVSAFALWRKVISQLFQHASTAGGDFREDAAAVVMTLAICVLGTLGLVSEPVEPSNIFRDATVIKLVRECWAACQGECRVETVDW